MSFVSRDLPPVLVDIKHKGQIVQTRVSADDYEWVKKHTWHLSNGYAKTLINARQHSLHRLIMRQVDNFFLLPCVDHIDGDKLNNVRDNLRWVTHSQNSQNNKVARERMAQGLPPSKHKKKYRFRLLETFLFSHENQFPD
jgi:HNH endonuclease